MLKRLRYLIISIVATSTIVSSTSIIAFAQSDTPQQFKAEVLSYMKNRDTSFSINYTGNPTEFIEQANTFIKEASVLDEYLNLSLVNQSASISGTNGNLNVSLDISYLTTVEEETFIDQEVTKIVSLVVTTSMTTENKIKVLYDYVRSITSYDYTLQRNSAYTALVEKKTMHRGYTLLLYKLYDKLDIPTRIVVGELNGASHAWNMVEVDGKWYHIDATSDDANNNTKYFMASDADLTSYGFEWIKSNYPPAIDEGTDVPSTVQQKLIEATNAIFIAETSMTLADKVIAEEFVNALPTGTDKTALIERLTGLQQAINLNSTTISVIKAEITPTQDNINLANQAIALLPIGENKTALQEKITAILAIINQQKLKPVTDAVIKAEKSVLLVDANSAQIIVNALPIGTDKTAFNLRLKIVNQYILTTNLVVLAEQAKTQIAVSTAIKSVNLLTDGDVKIALQERLQAIQTIIDVANLDNATKAVIKAETSLLTIDVTNAQKLITILADGDAKTLLTVRLKDVNLYVLTINLVATAEKLKTQVSVNAAIKSVDLLVGGNIKIALQERLKVVQTIIDTANLNNATNSVIKAETSLLTTDVINAQKLVAILADGVNKTFLLQKLQAVQVIVDNANLTNATNAVIKAETSLLTTDVVNAQKLVTILSDVNTKTPLQSRLIEVTKEILENAISAVAKAETSLTLVDKVSAEKLVNALPVSNDKTSLTLRLKDVNQYIVTINLVVTAERSKTQVSVNTAIKSVDLLVGGTTKTALQERLKVVQEIVDNTALLNSTNAVEKAETSLLTTDVANAQKLVTILADGTNKTSLQKRLTDVTTKILENAISAVAKAEASLTLVDKVSADKLVNALPVSDDKTSLIVKLKAVNQNVVTINLVVTAEKSKTQASVNTAIKSVDLLVDGNNKTDLQVKLKAVQVMVDSANLANATIAVVKAETSLLTTDVIKAQKLVTVLADGDAKILLQKRLTDVTTRILENAISAVIKAEESLILADKASADKLVNALPTSTDKTSLALRLKIVNQCILTTKLVAAAEKAVTQASVNTAIKSVNLLPDGKVKTSLRERLQAIKIVISL